MHSQFNYDTSTKKIQIRELHITLQTKNSRFGYYRRKIEIQ